MSDEIVYDDPMDLLVKKVAALKAKVAIMREEHVEKHPMPVMKAENAKLRSENERLRAELGILNRDHHNACDTAEAYRSAAAKAMAELRLILPYLPDETAVISQGVFQRIEETSPPIPHGEYMYCAQCGEQHEQNVGVIDGKCQLLQKREAAEAAKEKNSDKEMHEEVDDGKR